MLRWCDEHCQHVRAADVLGQRANQAALADARLARDVDDRRRGRARPRPSAASSSASSASRPNIGVSRARPDDLDPAAGAAGPEHAVHGTGWSTPFSACSPERLELEVRVDQRAHGVADHHRRGRAERLQPCGRRAASCRSPRAPSAPRRSRARPRPRRRCAGRLAPCSSTFTRVLRCCELLDDRQPGVDRALRVVLVRPRVAEVGDQPVAGPLRRPAVEARPPPPRTVAGRRPGARGSPRDRASATSSVEPTRSQNITVTCSRCALSSGAGAASGCPQPPQNFIPAGLANPH